MYHVEETHFGTWTKLLQTESLGFIKEREPRNTGTRSHANLSNATTR